MKITDLISLERIRCNASVKSKKKALELLSTLLAPDASNASNEEIFESLINRERLGSTGLGHGVALPHARLQGQDTAIGAFVKLEQPVDFDAIDRQPTDLLFTLLVPDHFTDEHLDILAQLAKMFSEESFCDKLRKSSTDEQLEQLLKSYETGSAV
ncbi:MAG TPA: PTS IIA-like nitrogen-regulatory protein PtsN [Gammaproteobacteria bacterium]|nr:PTS IIA-like nitrogen-regulatory protein PtsN [Gammaproteobacteria bacterium]